MNDGQSRDATASLGTLVEAGYAKPSLGRAALRRLGRIEAVDSWDRLRANSHSRQTHRSYSE